MNSGLTKTSKNIPLIESFDRREFLISRILSGSIRLKLGNDTVVFKWPDSTIRYEALELYQEILENSEVLDEEAVVAFLINENMWSFEEEELVQKKLPEDIDNFKVAMFDNILNTPKLNSYRLMLDTAKGKSRELWAKRNAFYYMTAEGVGIYSKQLILLEKSIDRADVNLNAVFDAFQNSMISEEDMRCLAKTEPWRGIWAAHKKTGTLFPSELTEEQRRLVQWSSFYDSVYEIPECPTEEIIQDDDILDGWSIKRRKEYESEKKKQFGENVLGKKHEKADELFLVVGNEADAKKVYDMNSGKAKIIQQARLSAIKAKGEVKESDLPDRKMEIRTRLAQMESERFKQ